MSAAMPLIPIAEQDYGHEYEDGSGARGDNRNQLGHLRSHCPIQDVIVAVTR
jgi:hypothetical protein